MPSLVTILVAFVPALPLAVQDLDIPSGGTADAPAKKARGPRRDDGLELPGRQKGDLAPKPSDQEGGDGLDLPQGAPPATPPPAADAPRRPDVSRDLAGAAAFVLSELEKARRPDSSLALSAVDTLIGYGEPGIEAARAALWRNRAAVCTTGGRVLLAAGTDEDRRAVVQRLRSDLPKRAGAPLLRGLIERDPVLATPELMIELIGHVRGDLRQAAHVALGTRVGAEHLHHLAVQVQSKRAGTRELAIDLVATIDDPAALHLLRSRLGDSSAGVAARASRALALATRPEVDTILLDTAFVGPATGRERAYALLALCAREEADGNVRIGEERIPSLLDDLNAFEPIVSGASAIALAGVGFRSPRSRDWFWLDLAVPHALVKLSSGAVFHEDFRSLQEPGLRRLALLTGREFGSNGPAWQAFWAANADGFRSRRAVIELRAGEAATLDVTLVEGGRALRVVGGAAERVASEWIGARTTFASARECDELVALFEREGLFTAARLPARVSDPRLEVRVLEVRVAGQGKRFELPTTADAPWFGRALGAVRASAERNRWQVFFDPGAHADQRAFWEAERGFFDASPDAEEAARWMVQQALAALAATPVGKREDVLAELERQYAEGAARPIDFSSLRSVLAAAPFWSGEALRITELCVVSGRAAGGADGRLPETLGRELITVLIERFGLEARDALVPTLEACGAAIVSEAATHEQPEVRAIAAAALGRERSEASVESLIQLLRDAHELVEAAAVDALGENGIDAAETELLVRARVAAPHVRSSALRAVARLGYDDALDVLTLGLADSNPRVQRAAAEGLGDLAHPESATLLSSMFARGRESVFFEPARRGLRELGAIGQPELLRLTLMGARDTRREAALLLSEQGVAEVTSTLISILTDRPSDARVASELAVLTAVDLRDADDPPQAWWNWWDGVVHDDSLAWFRAACEREGLLVPASADLVDGGTPAGALALIEVLRHGPPHLLERARRELARLLAHDIVLPAPGEMRTMRFDELAAEAREWARRDG